MERITSSRSRRLVLGLLTISLLSIAIAAATAMNEGRLPGSGTVATRRLGA
jgi:hypothetical protein